MADLEYKQHISFYFILYSPNSLNLKKKKGKNKYQKKMGNPQQCWKTGGRYYQ
jgi:hypothetical protein